MKANRELFLFTGGCLFLGLSWTNAGVLPLWSNAVMVVIGSILAGVGLGMRRQHTQQLDDEREERRIQMWDQANRLLVQIVEAESSKMGHIPQLQQAVSEGFQGLRKVYEEQLQHTQTSLNRQLSQQHTEHIQTLQRTAEQIITAIENSQASVLNVVTTVEKVGKDIHDANSRLLVEQRRVVDSVTDLEYKISNKADQLLDMYKEDQELLGSTLDKLEIYFQKIEKQYDEFTETMKDYLLKVKHAVEDIEEYRGEIEQDLRDRVSVFQSIVNRLEETATQLADSKHHERELALKVQKKLNEQLTRLSSRG